MKTKIAFKTLVLVTSLLILIAPLTIAYNSVEKQQSTINDYPEKSLESMGSKIQTIIDSIDETMLYNYLESLVSFAPRRTGTYGCEKAAEYIYNQFNSMGIETSYQDWSERGNQWNPEVFNSKNIEGVIPGTESEKIIIFNAHYDTITTKSYLRRGGFSPGADDDGSGVAAVLAAAYILSNYDFKHTIKFVAVSGEEQGLLGSHAYAKEAYENKEDILVDFNADMIGHAETADGGNRFRIYGTRDVNWIMDEIESINEDYGINFDLTRSITNEEAERGGSDYFSFVEYGFETVAFFESEWCPYMHTPDDTIENVNFSYLVNTTRLIVGSIAQLADIDILYPHVELEYPRRGKLYQNEIEKRNIADLKTIVIGSTWIWANTYEGDAPITRAEFYYDDTLEFVDTEAPYKWYCDRLSLREHKITIVIYDQLGQSSNAWQNIRFINLRRN